MIYYLNNRTDYSQLNWKHNFKLPCKENIVCFIEMIKKNLKFISYVNNTHICIPREMKNLQKNRCTLLAATEIIWIAAHCSVRELWTQNFCQMREEQTSRVLVYIFDTVLPRRAMQDSQHYNLLNILILLWYMRVMQILFYFDFLLIFSFVFFS